MKWICFILLSFLFGSYDCAPKTYLIEMKEDPIDETEQGTVLNEDGGKVHEEPHQRKSGDYGAKR